MLNDYRKSESEFGPIDTDFFNTIGQVLPSKATIPTAVIVRTFAFYRMQLTQDTERKGETHMLNRMSHVGAINRQVLENNGGRYKVRTCDPYDVNVVLYH